MRHAADGDAYAQVRLHARYAQLLPSSDWQQLIRVSHFAAFVQQARETPLRGWIEHFDPRVEVHRIEASLRDRYQQENEQVTAWLPEAQRPAIAWLRQLPLLAGIRYRAADGRHYAWLAEADAAAQLAPTADGGALVDAWLQRWRQLWPPRLAREDRGTLQTIERRWAAFQQELREPAGATSIDTPDVQLELHLRRIFRRQRCALLGATAYLGLLWLQTARVRGALLRRRIFVSVAVPAA